jgi:ABC-2 type transport system permease protein
MSMIFAVIYREYRIRTTSMTWLFYDLFMPLTYLLLFGVGLDRAFHTGIASDGSTVSYNAFFLAGVLAMASFGIAINTSYGFFVDRDNGIFYEFLTYPMTRAEFLIGKILFNCFLSLLQATITVTIGVSVLGIPLLWERIPAMLIGILVGTAGWFFFLTSFALRIRRNDIFNTVLNVAYFVLMFASTLFYPLDGLPQWLRWASLANPLTWHTDVLRYLTIGTGSGAHALFEAVLFLLFLGGSFWIAVRTLTHDILH